MATTRVRRPLNPIYTDADDWTAYFPFFIGDLNTPNNFGVGDSALMTLTPCGGGAAVQLSTDADTLVFPQQNTIQALPGSAVIGALVEDDYVWELRVRRAAGPIGALLVGQLQVFKGLSVGGRKIQAFTGGASIIPVLQNGDVIEVVDPVSGPPGEKGWAALILPAFDGDRQVWQLVDWLGGTGAKPATGYLGAAGIVDDIADAVTVIPAPGWVAPGSGTAAAASAVKNALAGTFYVVRSIIVTFDNLPNGPNPTLVLKDGNAVIGTFYIAYPPVEIAFPAGVPNTIGYSVSAVLTGTDSTVNCTISLHGESRT